MLTKNKGRLYKKYYRNGEEHRGGADVSFGDIVKVFGFRTIQIGRWVTKEEQQIAANLFFDAICDLMEILAIPKQVISLRGTLGLAFGVGGNKYSSAHYNSAKRQLALAKNAGGGALAHEWFHAFDHYICDKMYTMKKTHLFASEVWLNNLAALRMHPLNNSLDQAYRTMFLDEAGNQSSRLVSASIEADKSQNIFYFARPQEISARCFERVIQEHPIKNSFLVSGTMHSAEAQLGLYPSGLQLQAIQQATLNYFCGLGKALR